MATAIPAAISPYVAAKRALAPAPVAGMIEEVFNLDEGPVTLTIPAVLSPESYEDMADRIEIFMRGLKRRSDAEVARRLFRSDEVPE